MPALPTSVTLARTVADERARIIVTLDDGSLVSVHGERGTIEETVSGAPDQPWRSIAGALDETPGDEVVVLAEDGRIVLFRSDGEGGLAAGQDVGTNQDPSGLAVGDVDGDGEVELVMTARGSANVQVVRLGDGGLEDAGSFGAGIEPDSAGLHDVDGDGLGEVLLAGEGRIEIWSLSGAPRRRLVLVGLLSGGSPLEAFSLGGAGDEWVAPLLFGHGRWDTNGELSWQQYVMTWLPRP